MSLSWLMQSSGSRGNGADTQISNTVNPTEVITKSEECTQVPAHQPLPPRCCPPLDFLGGMGLALTAGGRSALATSRNGSRPSHHPPTMRTPRPCTSGSAAPRPRQHPESNLTSDSGRTTRLRRIRGESADTSRVAWHLYHAELLTAHGLSSYTVVWHQEMISSMTQSANLLLDRWNFHLTPQNKHQRGRDSRFTARLKSAMLRFRAPASSCLYLSLVA